MIMIILFSVTTSFLIFICIRLFLRKKYPGRGLISDNPVIDGENIDRSYVLLAPFTSLNFFKEGGTVFLLDLYGRIVHKWNLEYQIFVAYLKKNGHLVASCVVAGDLDKYPGGGRAGRIVEVDWNGEVLWEYNNDYIHHDIDIMPNGNVIALMFEKAPHDFSQQVKGGIPGSEKEGNMWTDSIIEINHEKKIVWQWHAFDHLEPMEYELNEFTPRCDLMHTNSLRYVNENPIDGTEAFLISMRHISTIALIRKSDGSIIWKSPKGMFASQHDATLLDNGNILVFDNGLFRMRKKPALWSRIVELDPRSNNIIWELKSGKSGPEVSKFSASILSGCQKLQNGNIFAVNGTAGYLFEITHNKKIVWDFINPYNTYTTGPWPNNVIFKARRYRKDEIDWPEKLSNPLPCLVRGLKKIF
jgi:hypothetical protein